VSSGTDEVSTVASQWPTVRSMWRTAWTSLSTTWGGWAGKTERASIPGEGGGTARVLSSLSLEGLSTKVSRVANA
jgi:hypothetical protein